MIINFEVSQESQCGYFVVTDTTDLVNAEIRSSYGFIPFWIKDNNTAAVTGDLSNDGSDDERGTFPIENSGYGNYQFICFIAPAWDEIISYTPGQIVMDNLVNKFYICNDAIQSTLNPSWDNLHWYLIDVTNATTYQYFIDAGNCQIKTITLTSDCSIYSITKTDCHKYTITDNSTPANQVNVYTITDYKGTVIPMTEQFLEGGSVDIELPDDNVYKIVIEHYDQSAHYETLILEWCDLRNCMESMINTVLAKCDDPCSESCVGECANQIEIFRNELNKMIAIYFPMIGLIYADVIQFAGMITVDEGRADNAYLIGDMITQLKAMSERCGVCNGTTLGGSSTSAQTTSSPCNC